MGQTSKIFNLILSILFLSALTAGCAGESSGTGDNKDMGGNVTLSTGLMGTVSVEGGNNGAEKDAKVFVIGQEGSATATDASGNYAIGVDVGLSGLLSSKPGERTALAAPASNDYYLVVHSSDKAYGTVAPFTLLEGEVKTVDPVINGVGSISGTFILQDQADHTGILVYVPGTSFAALTDASGNFAMDVPSGWYPYLRAEKDGYLYSVVSGVLVQKEQATTLAPQQMAISIGVTGKVMINAGESFTTTPDSIIFINATSETVLMLIADNPFFLDTEWKKFETPIPYTFSPGDGQREIYVKLADANGLESATYYDTIYLDTDPLATRISPVSVSNSVNPVLDWDYQHPMPNPQYRVQIAFDSQFTNIAEEVTGLAESGYASTVSLNDFGLYYWRVAMLDESGRQWGWSGPWSFTVDTTAVLLHSPENLSMTNNETPALNWYSHTSATHYVITVSQNADLSAGLVYTAALNSYTLPPFSPTTSSTYYWAVTPHDESGIAGKRSDIWSFTLDTVAPTGSVTINSGETVTAMTSVLLNLTAADAGSVTAYYASEGSTLPPSPAWTHISSPQANYDNPSAPFTLSAVNGTKTVYVWFKDSTGNISAPDSATIEFELMEFNLDTIDYDLDVWIGHLPSLALDSQDRAHIAFSNYTDHLNYITNATADDSWSRELIGNYGNMGAYIKGTYSMMKLDSLDNAHVVYSYGDTDPQIRYASNSSGAWVINTVDAVPYSIDASMVIDKNDKVHIAYWHYDTVLKAHTLRYATNAQSADGSWTVETVLSDWTLKFETSIALDSADRVYIAYVNLTLNEFGKLSPWKLSLVTNATADSSWETSILDSGIDSGTYNPSMEMDSNDKVHIAYHYSKNVTLDGVTSSSSDIKYITNATGSWIIDTIDDGVHEFDSAMNPAIALDRNDKVHIGYGYSEWPGVGSLRYATNKYPGGWAIAIVAPIMGVDHDVPYFDSLGFALDSTGRPHLSYRAKNGFLNTHVLKYAVRK